MKISKEQLWKFQTYVAYFELESALAKFEFYMDDNKELMSFIDKEFDPQIRSAMMTFAHQDKLSKEYGNVLFPKRALGRKFNNIDPGQQAHNDDIDNLFPEE